MPSWTGGLLVGGTPALALPVPGYVLWLDGSNLLNNNTTWYDQSGNGYNAVAIGTPPTYTPDLLPGLGGYTFGMGGSLQTPAFSLSSLSPASVTVMAVILPSNTVSDYGEYTNAIVSAAADSTFAETYYNIGYGGYAGIAPYSGSNTGGYGAFISSVTGGATYGGAAGGTDPFLLSTFPSNIPGPSIYADPLIVTCVFEQVSGGYPGYSYRIYINGALVSLGATPTGPVGWPADMYRFIGMGANGNNSGGGVAGVFEIVEYPTALSDTDRRTLHNFFAAKYNIANIGDVNTNALDYSFGPGAALDGVFGLGLAVDAVTGVVFLSGLPEFSTNNAFLFNSLFANPVPSGSYLPTVAFQLTGTGNTFALAAGNIRNGIPNTNANFWSTLTDGTGAVSIIAANVTAGVVTGYSVAATYLPGVTVGQCKGLLLDNQSHQLLWYVDASTSTAFAISSNQNTDEGTLVYTVPLAPITAGGTHCTVAGNYLCVFCNLTELQVIDVTSGAVVGTYTYTGLSPVRAAGYDGSAYVWASGGSGTLVIDPSTGAVVTTLPSVGGDIVTFDGERMLVSANGGSDTGVSRYNPTTYAQLDELYKSSVYGPTAIAPLGGLIVGAPGVAKYYFVNYADGAGFAHIGIVPAGVGYDNVGAIP